MAKSGLPSCVEITDAAMGECAVCLMLNKGVAEAVSALGSILWRMEAHQEKKRSMLHPLRLAAKFSRSTYDFRSVNDQTYNRLREKEA